MKLLKFFTDIFKREKHVFDLHVQIISGTNRYYKDHNGNFNEIKIAGYGSECGLIGELDKINKAKEKDCPNCKSVIFFFSSFSQEGKKLKEEADKIFED